MRRLDCLDGLRGVLAVYVMVSHMAPFALLPVWLAGLLSHGGAGVDAFFVLSGMVIVQSLESHGYRRGRFLAARAWRIFPVYLPVLAAAIAVQALDRPGEDLFTALPWVGPESAARHIWALGWPRDWPAALMAHLTMTHGLAPDAVLPDLWVGFLGAAWSLSTEWQFYALAALAAPWLRRGRLSLHGFAALLLGLAAAGLLWRFAAPQGWTFSRAFLPNKAEYFALGVVSAALWRAGRPAVRGGEAVQFALVFAAALALCLGQEPRPGPEKLAVPLIWLLVLAAQAWPRTTLLAGLARALRAPAAQWLGAVSYPLYLVNEPVQKLLGRSLAAVTAGDGAAFTAVWLPAALVLPLGAAWLLHRAIELPTARRYRARGVRGPGPLGARVVAPRGDSLCAAPGWISRQHTPKQRIITSASRMG